MGEQRRRHRLAEQLVGVAVGAHAALLDDHVALRRHHVVVEGEAGHAVGLELHHGGQMLLGDALEVGRVVVGREGVLLAAEGGDDIGELARRMLGRSLEHQVLEEMRDAGLAERIVGRAVAIPDHVGDDRRAPVGNDHHLKPVGERRKCDTLGPAAGRGRGSAAPVFKPLLALSSMSGVSGL